MRLGIIAGYGEIPLIAAKSAKEQGYEVYTVALYDSSYSLLENISDGIIRLSIGQASKILKYLKTSEADSVIFIGKIDKDVILEKPRFDLKAARFMAGLINNKDDTIMHKVGEEFEKNGFKVLKQTDFLSDLLAPEGVYSKKKPDDAAWADINFGFEMAKEIGRLDIGQTVVVRNCAVMAVEAIEGTNRAVERGCRLAKKNAAVVKAYRPAQDERFDIPVVGVDTIKNIADNKGGILAVEAGKTFIVDFEACVKLADKHNIIFLGI